MTVTRPARRRVLVVDPLHESAIERLREAFEVRVELSPAPERLRELLAGGVEVLVMRSGVELPAAALRAARGLRVIARAGAGVDNIDVAAAREAGIVLFNVPGESARAVAEFTFGLALNLTRRIALASTQVRLGEWRKRELLGQELAGSTIGVVGLGQIGSVVARLALAFGMRVVASVAHPSTPRQARLRAEGIELMGLTQLLREADLVCLLVPLTDSTRGLIGDEQLALLGRHSYLINVARGGVVDEEALYGVLSSGALAGAALDVVSGEVQGERLASLENVIVTPHIAAMTEQAQRRIGARVVSSTLAALEGAPVPNRIC